MKQTARLYLLASIASLVCLATPGYAQLAPYSQDFEALVQTDPGALGTDGWLVFGNLFNSGGTYILGYGPFPAPNGNGAFSDVDAGEGGPNQGVQQLVVYSDYQCCPPGGPDGHFNGTDLVESNVYQEQTITAGDVGSTWTFGFHAKRGNIDGSTTAQAFIKTLDPNAGFALTNYLTLDMTGISTLWQENNRISITIDASLVGQLLQFGFLSTASNFEPSGIFYDNIVFERDCGNSVIDDGETCDDANTSDGDGCSASCQVEPGFACSNPVPPNAVADPSFEAGTPNPSWAEASTAFGTPLCDIGGCGTGGGTGPSDGDWWAWFGGVSVADETGSVEQSVVIPSGYDTLSFDLEIPTVGTTGFLNVLLDGNLLATFSEADGPFVGYQVETRNIPGFADNASHVLRFESTTIGGAGTLNFFVDDVRIFDREAAPSVCTISSQICSTPALPLPDNDPAGVSDSVLAGDTDPISDLDVSITTTHTFVGDLAFELEHVDTGTSVVLIDRPGVPAISSFGCGNNNIDVVLDDAAGTAAEDQCEATPPAIGGTQTPNNPLSAFNGESLAGTWTLTVSDNAGGDLGVLEEWCLQPTTVSVPDSDGDGVLDDVDNCTDVQNPGQEDINGDLIGDICDADVEGPGGDLAEDCFVNFLDLQRVKDAFFANPASPTWDPEVDFDGSSLINFSDLQIMKDQFFGPPGPSAAGCDAPD